MKHYEISPDHFSSIKPFLQDAVIRSLIKVLKEFCKNVIGFLMKALGYLCKQKNK